MSNKGAKQNVKGTKPGNIRVTYNQVRSTKTLLARGLNMCEISRRLGITPATVKRVKDGVYDDLELIHFDGSGCSEHGHVDCVECHARVYDGPLAPEYDDDDPVMDDVIRRKCAEFRRKHPRKPERSGDEPESWELPVIPISGLTYAYLEETHD